MDGLVTLENQVTERIFEETLTKEQLDDMLKNEIRPAHWEDGIASYFRVQKIIDLLQEDDKPLDPNLDVAITVLSAGRARIRNQSHKDFCRDIKAKMDDLEGQTDDDLHQPVEWLAPGCFPIGPECESLGILGDILFDKEKSFPEAIDPDSISNRVMFELSEYVTRTKETYKTLAGWIKKIMGWGDEYDVTYKMVDSWCTTLMRETKKRKKSSLSLAQKYLLQKFQFSGLEFPTTSHGKEDTTKPSLEHPPEASGIAVEFSEDDAENDKEEAMDISGFLQEGTEVDKPPSEKKLPVTSSSPVDGDENGEIDGNDSGGDIHNGSDKELSSGEEEEAVEASTSQSSRKTSPRSAAKTARAKMITPESKTLSRGAAIAARAKMSTPESKTISRGAAIVARAKMSKPDPKNLSRGAAIAARAKMSKPDPKTLSRSAALSPLSKKETRQSTSSKNTKRRAPAKKTTAKVQKPARSSGRQRILESSDDSSTDEKPARSSGGRKRILESSDDSNSGDQDDDDEDDEDEEDEEEDEEDDDNSIEEGEVRTIRRKSVNTSVIKRDIAEAAKLFTSMSGVVNTLKKDMRVAMDYLESQTAKICKNLQKAEKKLDNVMKMVELDKAQHDSEDEVQDESSEEEESDEEKPVRRTRGSQQTKKITVQVQPGVKAKLKRPLVNVKRLSPRGGHSHTQASAQSTKVTRTPIKVSRQKMGSRASSSTKSMATEEEINNFDKEKLFSSRVSVSLVKISSKDLVKKTLEEYDHRFEDNDEESTGLRTTQRHCTSFEKSGKTSARKSPARRGPEPKMDSDDEKERSDEEDGEMEEDNKLSNRARRRSGQFQSKQKTADVSSVKNKNSRKVTSESSKRQDSDNSDVDEKPTSKNFTRSNPRESRNGRVNHTNTEMVSSEEEEEKQPSRSTRSSRSSRSRKTKEDSDKGEGSSPRSRKGRDKSPLDKEEIHKSSEIEPPYSGSEDEAEIPKKPERSAFATLAAGMSSFGDWRGASAKEKEKVKKRSLNDFVKQLNSPKRRKTDSGKKSSPGKINAKHQPNDKSSEEDDTELNEEENDDDDFLEKQTEMELKKQKSNGSTTQEKSTKPQNDDKMDETNDDKREHESPNEFETESQVEGDGAQNQSEKCSIEKDCSEDIPAIEKTQSNQNADEAAKGNSKSAGIEEKEFVKDDEFPGDGIVGKRIRHRCSLGKHGLYKWYEGKVVHKTSPSELLKLDEEQIGHLNNLYTFYTVKYDGIDELHAKALAYDWDRENLVLCS